MAVSGTMAIDRTTLWAGSGAIAAQRGPQTWGANYVFHRDGIQEDILVISEEFKNLSTSGAFATDAELSSVSGALQTQILNPSGATTYDTFKFDTSGPTIPTDEGYLFWDADDKTLAARMSVSGVTLQIGQESHLRVVNKTGQTITNGALVHVNGSQGNRPTVTLAHASGTIDEACLCGMITHTVLNNAEGYVTTEGLVRGLSTKAYTEGDTVYLAASGGAGGFTATAPTAPYHTSKVGIITNAHKTQGSILIKPKPAHTMSDLSDFDGTVPISGDIMVYHPSGYWEASNTIRDITVGYGGNTTTIDASGHMTMQGSGTVWDDLRFPVTSLRVGAAAPPAFAKYLDNGAGSAGVYGLMFDGGGEEQVWFTAQLPHSWKESSNIEAHVHWSATDGNAGWVKWGVEYTVSQIGGNFPPTAIIYGSGQVQGASGHVYTDIDPWIDMSAISGVSPMLVCRLFRDGGNDSYGSDAALFEVDFHYELDSLGSNTESSKT